MSNEYRQLADPAAEDRLRWLSNFLADEPQWDRRTLLRLGAWAASTVGALVIAILSYHWTQDLRREQVAALDLARQSQSLQATAQAENRRLTAAIETLNGDRDRLFARVTVLEQGLDSVTGAVTRQSVPASMVLLSATVPITLPPPAIAAPAVMPAHVSDPVATTQEPDAASAKSAPAAQVAAQPAPAQAAGPAAPGEPQRQAMPSPSLYAPPDPAAARLVETAPSGPAVASRDKAADKPGDKSADKNVAPAAKTEARKDAQPEAKVQIANTQPAAQEPAPAQAAAAPAAEAPPAPEVPAQRTDFGVDLGGANSLDGLRALWQGLLKSRSNAASLASLRPIVVIRERSNGLGMQLRLVAGPLSDAAAAAKICAALAGSDRGCETAVYDGQRLALRAPNEPAQALPVAHPLTPLPVRASTRHSRRASARNSRHEEPTPEPAPAAQPPATTQSTSSSVLPEFLRPR